MIIRISVSGGQIKANYPLASTLSSLPDGDYTLEVAKVSQKRSNNQNAYFHGVIVPCIAEYMWEIYKWMPKDSIRPWLEEAKEALINKYLPKKTTKNKLDKRRKVVKQKRTSDCDTKEFKDMIDSILHDFPNIPPPDGDFRRMLDYYQETYHI